MATFSASSSGSAPRRDPRGQRLAFQVLHHQEVDAVLVADVVQRADVRMVQRGDGLRFALEALLHLGVLRKCGGSTLMATVRFSRVSVAL